MAKTNTQNISSQAYQELTTLKTPYEYSYTRSPETWFFDIIDGEQSVTESRIQNLASQFNNEYQLKCLQNMPKKLHINDFEDALKITNPFSLEALERLKEIDLPETIQVKGGYKSVNLYELAALFQNKHQVSIIQAVPDIKSLTLQDIKYITKINSADSLKILEELKDLSLPAGANKYDFAGGFKNDAAVTLFKETQAILKAEEGSWSHMFHKFLEPASFPFSNIPSVIAYNVLKKADVGIFNQGLLSLELQARLSTVEEVQDLMKIGKIYHGDKYVTEHYDAYREIIHDWESDHQELDS